MPHPNIVRSALSRSLNMPSVDFDVIHTHAAAVNTASAGYHPTVSRSTTSDAVRFASNTAEHKSRNQLHSQPSAQPTAGSIDGLPSHPGSRGGGSRSGAKSVMGRIITDIDEKVWNLKELFRKGDPLEQRRRCASKIVAIVRGFLVRCRYDQHQKALVEWKWVRCRPVVHLLDILLANHSNRDAGINLLCMNRNMKNISIVFEKWAYLYRQNAPMRKGIRATAEERILLKQTQWLRTVFEGFRAATIGKNSTKNANTQRRLLVEKIRKNLSRSLLERGLPGVVPELEVGRCKGSH
jgi:hypothetical protein